MRRIGVVTTSRADYGIYLPLLRQIQADPNLSLHLLVTGMHLAPEFGLTVNAIASDGFPIAERIETLLASDTPEGIAKSMGLTTLSFAQSYARCRPDILVVLGDRFEMHAAALAALPFKIPIAHIHGGEVTQGAIDDALRHSLTKLSHLHFVSTETYRHRVLQLGEEPWRVIVTGAPGLDHLRDLPLWTAAELESRFGLRLKVPPLLVTFHTVTLEYEQTEWQVQELLSALRQIDLPIIFTQANADTQGRLINQKIQEFCQTVPQAQMVGTLGTQGYFSLMAIAQVMVGNSSSGIIEAASLRLPVVNIGTRQQGRVRGSNVIDVGYTQFEILAGIRQGLTPDFRAGLQSLVNPYGVGQASQSIIERLKKVKLDYQLLTKRFCDWSRVGMTQRDE